MSNEKSVVADAVSTVFTLSPELAERVAVAAEMAQDARFDYNKACDTVAEVFRVLKDNECLTFASWEAVRVAFEKAAAVRARDNGAIDPEGAGSDCWVGVTKKIREIHGLQKPKAENKDAQRMAEKRKADQIKAMNEAKGRSVAELESAKRELYSQATDESVAQAKALEKVIKVVKSAEKDAIDQQMKPLIAAANDQHKQIMEFMKGKNDPALLGDYVVLLKRTLEIWKDQA